MTAETTTARTYLENPPGSGQSFQTVYVPTEEARGKLKAYALFIQNCDYQKVLSAGRDGRIFLNGSVWKKTGNQAEKIFSDTEIGELVDNAEWYLKQVEEAGSVAFGSERDYREPVLVTRGELTSQYSIWVPIAEQITEAEERMVTGFERARIAGDKEKALDLLDQALKNYARIVVETSETGRYQIVGVQGIEAI